MYAIQNINTKEFVYGTDYCCTIHYRTTGKQRISKNQMLTYMSLDKAKTDFKHRRCGKAYRIVELKPIEVAQVIEIE